MIKIITFLLLFLYQFQLTADPVLPGVVAATDGDPSAVVAGCVNAITGDLVLGKEDLVVRGAVPLSICRSYVSGDGTGHDSGWSFFFPHFVMRFYSSDVLHDCVLLTSRSGGTLRYNYKGRSSHHMVPVLEKHAIGITNTASGILSGRTNCKNNSLFFDLAKKNVAFVNGEGLHSYYTRVTNYKTEEADFFVLVQEELANGCWIVYEHDEECRPTLAKVVNSDRSKVYSWARFHWEGADDDNHNVRVETSDHRELHYTFERRDLRKGVHGRFYLQDITGSLQREEHLQFPPAPKGFKPLLTEVRTKTGHRKIVYQYPDKKAGIRDREDRRCNRVKELWNPTGPHGEKTCTYCFSYGDIRKARTKGGTTWVTGTDGYKAAYRWTSELRPQSITIYDTTTSDRPLAMHDLMWGIENTKEVSDLNVYALRDGNNNAIWIKSYTYDDHFNPLTETMHGHFTGTYQGPVVFNGRQPIQGESYTHHYRYSQDDRNLLLEDREDNGRIIRYQYLPGTSLLTAKLIGDAQRIYQRELYEYDAGGLLIAEIVDDGTSDKPQDLKDVTHRMVKRKLLRGDGLPEKIEERYYDPQTQAEHLLKSTVLHYSHKLLVIQQDIFDSQGEFAYSLFFDYDDQDHLTRQTDPLGRATTFSYDGDGRLLCTQTPSGTISTLTYDARSLPIVFEKKTAEGEVQTAHLAFNARGHKVAATDQQGHTTYFHPNHQGKYKQIDHPDGSCQKASYNAMGCPIEQVSRAGEWTKTEYNSYGKPLYIRYRDGTEERFIYDRSSQLLHLTSRLGATTDYTYDILGRVLHTQVVDREGNLLSEESHVYRGPHLVQHIDAEGQITQYDYDAAGRKIAEHGRGTTTHFTYDSLGRLITTASEEARQEVTHDLLGQKISEKIFSLTGELHHEVCYTYDLDGHVIATTTTTAEGPSTEQVAYDGFGRQVLQIDPLGHRTTIQWEASTPGLLRKITTDPVGTQTIESIGAMQRTISKEILSHGQRLALTTYMYDHAGHCILEYVELGTKTIVTKREYAFDQLITLLEAAGTPEEKTTRYAYARGLLVSVQRPSGIVLSYTHDALGRTSTCQASSGEGYSYVYDRLSRLIAITDLTSGLTSQRFYDPTGAVSEENFLHGLKISYRRDRLGKPLAIILPDGSGIGYHWDASHLQEISRLDAQGQLLYRHTYEQYDLTGQPLTSTLIGAVASENYRYDLGKRPRERSTSFHEHLAIARNPLGNLLKTRGRLLQFTEGATFAYDPLQQLISENSPFFRHTFQFDAHGSPLQRDQQSCKTNHLYQLQEVGEQHFTYNTAGNLHSDHQRVYRYDAFDRLVAMEEPGKQKAEYMYDSWHRRMQKIVYAWKQDRWVVSMTHFYLYDGMLEIGATDETGHIIELRLLGNTVCAESGATVAIECRGRLYAPLHDLSGHIVGLVDATTRELVETYRYSSFGEVKICDSISQPLPCSITGNPWRYFGKRTDPESGLILFGRRYYHPQLSSWITPDPAETIDHPNLYLFLRGNPLNLRDAIGLSVQEKNRDLWYTPDRPNIYEHSAFGQGFSTGIGYGLYTLGYFFVPVPYVGDQIVTAGAYLADHPQWVPRPSMYFKKEGIETGDAVCYTNGICTSYEDVMGAVERQQQENGGHSIEVIYNATHGPILDILECALQALGVKTHPQRIAEKKLPKIADQLKEKFGKDPNFFWVAHSQGCYTANGTLKTMNETHPEIARNTYLYALGSPVIIDSNLAKRVDIRVSKWDVVGWVDVLGRIRNPENLHCIEPKGSFPGFDHALMGETYSEELSKICRKIRREGGW